MKQRFALLRQFFITERPIKRVVFNVPPLPLLPLPETQYEYLVRKNVTVSPDFSFVYNMVHYSMPRKYLRKTLEIRVADTKLYVYNDNGDLIRTHERSYTPKSCVVLPTDMPKEYSDYSFWNTPYFLAKAGNVGPNARALIQRVIEKFDYPVQSFCSCFGILKFTEKYVKDALESCCKYAILRGKCSYNYITNTISMYAHTVTEIIDRMACSLKPVNKDQTVTGAYKVYISK